MTLDEAKASAFFSWFHLMEVPDSGSSVRTFRPEGDKFHALVALLLTAGNNGRVTRMRLLLARSFIADPRVSSFARDIAKSFLGFALANDTSPALNSLAEEIQFRDLRGPVFMRGEPPKLPAAPSAAYRIFAGDTEEATMNAPHTSFAFRNEASQDGPVLAITAELHG